MTGHSRVGRSRDESTPGFLTATSWTGQDVESHRDWDRWVGGQDTRDDSPRPHERPEGRSQGRHGTRESSRFREPTRVGGTGWVVGAGCHRREGEPLEGTEMRHATWVPGRTHTGGATEGTSGSRRGSSVNLKTRAPSMGPVKIFLLLRGEIQKEMKGLTVRINKVSTLRSLFGESEGCRSGHGAPGGGTLLETRSDKESQRDVGPDTVLLEVGTYWRSGVTRTSPTLLALSVVEGRGSGHREPR